MSSTSVKIRIAGIVAESIVDGPGFRYVVFTQGCPHKCTGCHNPHTHDPVGGYEMDIADILAQIDKNPLLDGITLSGGEPMLQAKSLRFLAKEVKRRGLTVMIYSGYTYEQIMQEDTMKAILPYCDILVDGLYDQTRRQLSLRYRGSSNQRLIDVQATLQTGSVAEYTEEELDL